MTGIVAIRQRDSVSIMADGASTHLTSKRVTRIGSKLKTLPLHHCVVAGGGSVVTSHALAPALAEYCASFDEFLFDEAKRIEAFGSIYDDAIVPVWESAAPFFCWFVVGWSHTYRQPCLAWVPGSDFRSEGGDDYFALNPYQRRFMSGGPPVAQEAFMRRCTAMTDDELDAMDFEAVALETLEAMRAEPWGWDADATPGHIVGGFAELATVTSAGIVSSVVKEWPEDLAGELILPLEKRHDERAGIH